MPNAYNGWPAIKGMTIANGQLEPLVIAGESFSPGILAGDTRIVFEHVLNRVNNEVEPVVRPDWHQADDWGYHYKPNVNNPSQMSVHAAGQAVDYNATRHPNGKGGTWLPWQKAKILEILASVDNVIRVLWGYDEMHFEVCVTPGSGRLKRAADRIRGGSAPARVDPPPSGYRPINLGDVTELNTSGEQVRRDQADLHDTGFTLTVDGFAGPDTVRRIVDFQFAAGLERDGAMGPQTRAEIRKVPSWNNGVPVGGGYTARVWQQKLKGRGWAIVVDGDWGPRSVSILRQFQAEKKIDVTGARNYQTWSALHTRPA